MTTGTPPPLAAPSERRFAWWVAAAFAVLTLPRLLAHELWRDEAWLWLVVGESPTLSDLWGPLARSGQGNLFPFLAYLAHRVWASWRAMQVLHLLIASGAAFAFVRWAPLSRRQRALFLLGYFPFYEYAVISRHYAAGMLLTWLAIAATRGRRPALGLGLALGLLCQTTVYGFVLAAAIAAGWLGDRWLQRRELAPLPRGEALVGLACGLAGAVAGVCQLRPLPGTSFAPAWHFGWEPELAARVLRVPWRAFVPLPRPELHFWNSNLLDGWPALQTLLGVTMLALAVALLWPRRAALLAFGVGGLGLAAFAYLKYVGAERHGGHWWLLFAGALWLGGGLDAPPGRPAWRSAVLSTLLVAQVAAAAFASGMDLAHPFSNGARAAQRLRELGPDPAPLLGYREPPAASVALALGRPLYAPSRRLFTTHPDWGPEQRDLGPEELRCAARELAQRSAHEAVLVLNHRLPPWPEVELAASIEGAIVASEDYYLYRLRRSGLAATALAAACPPRD